MGYANWRKMKIARHAKMLEDARWFRERGRLSVAMEYLERAAVIRAGILCARETFFEAQIYGAANSGHR